MLKFTEFTKKFLKNPAVSGTLIVTIGALIGSVFNYLLQFFLGRYLSVTDYGIFNALLSFSVILMVLSGSLSTSLIKTVADIKVDGRFDILTKLFYRLTVFFLLIGLVIFFIVLGMRSRILGFFHIEESRFVSGFAFYMSLTFLSILAPAFLQGLLRFKAYAFWNILSSIFRLSVPALLVIFGMRVEGVYLGIGASMILSYLLSIFLLKKNFSLLREIPLGNYYKRLLFFAGPVVFINLGMTVLNNIDVIMVKHYFNPEMAGLYSGVVTLGKIFLFGSGTVSVVMYPLISTAYAGRENVFKKVKPFLLIQLVVLFCGLIVFILLPGLVTKTMFGVRYLSSVEYLPRFTVFAAFYVVSNFFTMFLLAINRNKIYVFHLFAVIVQLVLIQTFHNNIQQIINMNIISSMLLALSLLGYFAYLSKAAKTNIRNR